MRPMPSLPPAVPMSERFAVLDHDWPTPHRDLFLERDGVLLSWRLPWDVNEPFPLDAVATAPHRLHYLDYEGPVDGDRGTVTRWDSGPLEWVAGSSDILMFHLDGAYYQGFFELREYQDGRWLMCRI